MGAQIALRPATRLNTTLSALAGVRADGMLEPPRVRQPQFRGLKLQYSVSIVPTNFTIIWYNAISNTRGITTGNLGTGCQDVDLQ